MFYKYKALWGLQDLKKGWSLIEIDLPEVNLHGRSQEIFDDN